MNESNDACWDRCLCDARRSISERSTAILSWLYRDCVVVEKLLYNKNTIYAYYSYIQICKLYWSQSLSNSDIGMISAQIEPSDDVSQGAYATRTDMMAKRLKMLCKANLPSK